MSEAATPMVCAQRTGDVLRLRLDRPERGNALSRALVEALTQAVDAAGRTGVRLLVLEGSGRHFCTGFDLSTLDEENDDLLLARFVRVELLLQAVHAAPMPTLAIAHGRTMGAGADLFAACTSRWVSGEASFAFPGAGFGLVLGTGRLADIVGAERAQAWVSSGASIGTAQALEAGLATAQFAPQEVDGRIAQLAASLQRLDSPTQSGIQAAMQGARQPRGACGAGRDLLQLALSAARPGLKARIAAYRAALSAR